MLKFEFFRKILVKYLKFHYCKSELQFQKIKKKDLKNKLLEIENL